MSTESSEEIGDILGGASDDTHTETNPPTTEPNVEVTTCVYTATTTKAIVIDQLFPKHDHTHRVANTKFKWKGLAIDPLVKSVFSLH